MTCPECNSPLVPFDIPPELREYVPEESEALAICTQCLSLHPTELSESDSASDFSRISNSFPTGEAAVPMALTLGLLESLALYRSEIETLLEHVERRGVDPLLVIDRLTTQGSTQPQWDGDRRRRQLEQFLD
jgi:hypothetical protein